MTDQVLQYIANTAKEMLAGAISFIEGARRISTLRFVAYGLQNDPDLRAFSMIDSETQDLPTDPEVRKLWSPAALATLQPKIDDAEAWAREAALPHCKSVIVRFAGENSN